MTQDSSQIGLPFVARRKTHPGVCFYALDGATNAAKYFAGVHGLPIVSEPGELKGFRTVFFSIGATRAAWELAKIAHLKGESEWIAGGNAVTNPTGISWAMDYVFIGDAFQSFQRILGGERDLPGMQSTREPLDVDFQVEPPFPTAYAPERLCASKGCRRRCLFCVTPWRHPYQEQQLDVLRDFLEQAARRKRRRVFLVSSAYNDLSYREELSAELEARGLSNASMSHMLGKLTDEFLSTRRSEILSGVEGMSERLRHVVNKPLPRAKLLGALKRGLASGTQFRASYQFNLPSETEDDFVEFSEDVRTMAAWQTSKASLAISLIPHQSCSHTPMQWAPIRYSVEMSKRLGELRREMFGSKRRGTSVYIRSPRGCLKWFREILPEWIPITPDVAAALRGAKPNEPLGSLLDRLSHLHDLGFLLKDKAEDFRFPWDGVRVHTPRGELWRFHEQMKRRLSRGGEHDRRH